MITDAIRKVVVNEDLSFEEAKNAMDEIMSGRATPSQIASLITALRMKKETIEEISAFATVMRAKATKISPKTTNLIDTCGTGGDSTGTFNISTATAFVVSAAGMAVAKHGNRCVSSSCGAADVLEALGVNINIEPSIVEQCIDEVGIGFLFAQALHQAMKYAGPTRKEIGIRTVFNILGPLTNPAGAKYQLLGVYDPALITVMANVLRELGTKSALVVHGNGLDEITTTGATKVCQLKDGKITTLDITPGELGLKQASLDDLAGGTPKENAQIIKDILEGHSGPKTDIVLLNAAGAAVAAEVVNDFKEGIEIARDSIKSGKALKKLNQLVEFTNG